MILVPRPSQHHGPEQVVDPLCPPELERIPQPLQRRLDAEGPASLPVGAKEPVERHVIQGPPSRRGGQIGRRYQVLRRRPFAILIVGLAASGREGREG